MNKAFKKYKCNFANTRFAKKVIASIRLTRNYLIAQVAAASRARISQIAACDAPKNLKKIAIEKCMINEKTTILRVLKQYQFPRWYK